MNSVITRKIKKGDKVVVLLGKDNGKEGTVDRVLSKEGKVIVSGVNMFKRHVRRYQGIEGGIIEIAKPLNVSNVALVCPKCKKVTRVGYEIKNNEKSRICKKCKEII